MQPAPGAITQSSEDGEIYNRQEPWPYGGGIGFPPAFEVDLKRTGAYFDPSQGQTNRYGHYMFVSVARH